MDFLWTENTPLSALEMVEKLQDKGWSEHYLRVILKSLEKKGAVECCGFEQRVNQYARRFRCTLTREEYFVQLAQYHGASLEHMLESTAVYLFRRRRDTEKEKRKTEELVQELEKIVADYLAQEDDEEVASEKNKKGKQKK